MYMSESSREKYYVFISTDMSQSYRHRLFGRKQKKSRDYLKDVISVSITAKSLTDSSQRSI